MKFVCLLLFSFAIAIGSFATQLRADDSAKPAADSATAGHATADGASKEAGAHQGEHHEDETDLSHANASAELHSPAELRFELAAATVVVFLLLLALLGKFAWGPIAAGLDHREQHIAEMISTAEKNQLAAEHRLQELEARLAAQADEAREAISAARREGEILKEKIIGEAHAAAVQEKEKAIEEIRSAKNLALREIAQKSVNTAVDLAKNLIHREVREADHAQLISDSLAQFQANNN